MAGTEGKAPHAGRALREIRRRRGLSQEALEQLSGVSQTTLSRYEGGQDMYLGSAVQLADALHISLDELTGRAELAAAGATQVTEWFALKDVYPNRGRLRALPEFQAAPPAVREVIERVPEGADDLTLFEWVDELRVLSMLHDKGQLEGVLHVRATVKGSGSERTARPPTRA